MVNYTVYLSACTGVCTRGYQSMAIKTISCQQIMSRMVYSLHKFKMIER